MVSSWLGITGFAVLSLIANIVFLIGCISPATEDIALYRVNVALLANGLQRLAVVDSGNETELLRSPELATYWYWGMSGICDVFEMTGETRCRRAFPPTQNLRGILKESLRDRLGNDQEQLTNAIVASWNATLNNISPSRLAAKEAKFAAQSKASTALAILASVLDAAIALLALYGVHGIIDTSEHGGPAIIILFVGAALRVLSCGIAGWSSSGDNLSNLSSNERIGFRGEEHIFRWLQGRLPGWSYENWTSKLRKHTGFSEFGEPEWQYADFTYEDHSLQMQQMLQNAGVPVSPQWTARTTYHLEVKSTPAECDAKFYDIAAIRPSAYYGVATANLGKLEKREALSSEVEDRDGSRM
ncbi:hypothetical protein MFIFM68171_06327 [Madurella fahalii]|uniref:Uncharacterized protein n=1 Tax=Madurella fahalii TaxID=1157608 RepID=A0ABQ0GEC9_9PEZI